MADSLLADLALVAAVAGVLVLGAWVAVRDAERRGPGMDSLERLVDRHPHAALALVVFDVALVGAGLMAGVLLPW